MFKNETIAAYSTDCVPQYTFTPTIIGLVSSSTIHLMDDAGQSRYVYFAEIDFPDTVWSGADGEIRTIKYSADYDPESKQLFFGEANGLLIIINLSTPTAATNKRIRISTDNYDVTCVKVLKTGTNSPGGDEGKEILISTRNKKVFRQPFRTDSTTYIQGEAGEVNLSSVGEGEILDFAYNGEYVAIDSRFGLYHSTNLSNGLDRVKDRDYRGYKIGIGQQYYW